MPIPAVVPMMAPTIAMRLRICHLRSHRSRPRLSPCQCRRLNRRTADPTRARQRPVPATRRLASRQPRDSRMRAVRDRRRAPDHAIRPGPYDGPLVGDPPDGARAEAIGFDTIWTPDELLWRAEDGPPRGVWDGVSMAGAVAAVTSRAKVGTWVLSALHRNPGIIAKTAETLDEISGGRFVFGLGRWSRVAGPGALLRPARGPHLRPLRGSAPDHHPAPARRSCRLRRHLACRPRPSAAARRPAPNAIPILIGGNGPRGQRAAARHADIWSGYAEERSHVDELGPRLASLDAICAEIGRDPATIGRSAGVSVRPLAARRRAARA